MKINKYILIAFIISCVAFIATQYIFADTTTVILPSLDGNYSQWTPKSGTVHYTMVDESACNGTTDYNYANTVGSRDSYGVNISSILDGSTITAIEITPCASRNKTGGGSATMNVFYRFDGVNSADAGNYALLGTTPTQLATTTFSGLSHLKNSSSTLQIGAVLSAGTKGARLGRIATVITYTPPVTPPAAPTNLYAWYVASSTTYVYAYWQDNSNNEDGFSIERGTDGINFEELYTTTANTNYYVDYSIATSTTYYYKVRAYNLAGYSNYSNTASTTIP